MGHARDSEAELRARIEKLEAELARSKSETEAWRKLFARTTTVLATFTTEMDELVESLRSGRPLTMTDERVGIAIRERADKLN